MSLYMPSEPGPTEKQVQTEKQAQAEKQTHTQAQAYSRENAKAQELILTQAKKCVIITTINATTEAIRKHMLNKEYHVIIVGDKKTPDCYKNEKCTYLDIETQEKLFPELSKLIPYNHYGRKNFGYLFAIKQGYDIIYETDDDNIPFDNFDDVLNFDNTIETIQDTDSAWINIFKYFTNNSWIWPRGYPLSLITKHPNPVFTFEKSKKAVSIINGLVENDPDVDSLFRLICNHDVAWEKNKKIIISNKNMCVFNTQNTFWVDRNMFIGLLLPCSVTFRYCDILKGIIANMLLRSNNKNMAYTSPNVTQIRNDHNLIDDFKSEYPMYIANEKILDILDEKKIEPSVKCLYLIQSSSGFPEAYRSFKNDIKYVLLNYKENTEETDIFFPNSTWTTGRNKLREYALKLKEQYDYYIFVDEDIMFPKRTQSFKTLENSLTRYRPYIGTPYLQNYPNTMSVPPTSNAYYVMLFDGICNAFSNEAFNNNKIFPYIDTFDKVSWHISQYIMIMLCSLYKKGVVLFFDVPIGNTMHQRYPRKPWDALKTHERILQKIQMDNPELNSLHLPLNITMKPGWVHKLDCCASPEYLQCIQMSADADQGKKNASLEKPISQVYQKELLCNIYKTLFEHDIITQLDLDICSAWLSHF